MFSLVASLVGCLPAAEYDVGLDLAAIEFVYTDSSHGVHPSTGILQDPNNPFQPPMGEDRWRIESSGYAPARYYSWASQLAVEAIGENQYYTAAALSDMVILEALDPYELYFAWEMAVAGHQMVLDEFPESVSYLADGETSFPLLPLAFEALISLGAQPKGWSKLLDDDGEPIYVPSGG